MEEVAENRTFAMWQARVDKRLEALGSQMLSLVSDRANILIRLAEVGLECLRMPDFFRFVYDIVKSYSLALGRCLRHAAHQGLSACLVSCRRA